MNLSQLPPWAIQAIDHKLRWMATGPDPQAPPILVPECAGQPVARVIVFGNHPEVYTAASMLRAGLDPDALIFISETFVATRALGDGRGEEMLADIRAGRISLEEIARRGGLERGEVCECMFAVRVGRDRRIEAIMLPFRAGRDEIEWQEGPWFLMPEPEGEYPDLLRQAMGHTPFADLPEVEAVRQVTPEIPAERARIMIARAALARLAGQPAYLVIGLTPDFLDLDEPPTGAPAPAPEEARR